MEKKIKKLLAFADIREEDFVQLSLEKQRDILYSAQKERDMLIADYEQDLGINL